jgi:ribose 5-phosphate isomerase A
MPAKAGIVVLEHWKTRRFCIISNDHNKSLIIMSNESGKRLAAEAALKYVDEDSIIGIGTGSTVNLFIDVLVAQKLRIRGAVSSSNTTSERLKQHKIEIFDLNAVGNIDFYFDGADECDPHLRLIKGGGAALAREKIIAAASRKFVCMVDESKQVSVLGGFPLPVEVIPMARSYVARQILAMGGHPVWRDNVITDNGNAIIDIHGLSIVDPVSLETTLNQIVGVVMVGLFARRPADVLIVGTASGVKLLP